MTCAVTPGQVLDGDQHHDGETTHACPIGDAAVTPCCGKDPLALPLFDRLTVLDELVTCGR